MRRCLPLAFLAALALASPALAQSPPPAATQPSGGIEEITITAEKRETNLQETPIAVTAITSQAIEEQGLEDFNDIQFVAPALVYGEIADMAQITMRGIGVDISTIDAEPGVALHQDGVYRGGLVSSSALLFDAERVEVLRGPQGTLYGRNSTGGSLNVITKLPGDELSFEGHALYGDYSRWRTEVAGDVPLIDGVLAVRGAFAYDSRGGYTKNTNTGNQEDDARSRQAKLAAHFTPTESLDVALRFNWLRSEYGGPPFIKTDDHPVAPLFISGDNPGGILGALPGISRPGIYTNDPRKVNYEGDQNYIRDNWDVNATVAWNLTDEVTVKWISAYLDLDQDLNPSNNDGIDIQLLVGDYEQANKEWQQEVDVTGTAFDGRLDWFGGFFYYDSQIQEVYRYTLPALQLTYEWLFTAFGVPFCQPTVTGPTTANPSNCLALFGTKLDGTASPVPFLEFSLDQHLTSWALFTQETLHLTDWLRMTGGFRWTKDHKLDVHNQVLNLDPTGAAGCGTALTPTARADETWSEPTGKLGIDADVGEDALAYFSYSRGFKAGGYNVGSCNNTYNPEFVNAYEIGAKTQWFDRTLQLNVSAFFNDYTDYQARLFINNAATVQNAANAETYGIEFELAWAPVEGLRIDAAYSILNAKFQEFIVDDPMNPTLGNVQCPPPAPTGALCQDARGNNLLRAPRHKVSVAAQYEIDLGAAGTLTPRGEYAYTSEQFHDVFNNGFSRQKPYNIGNVRLIWHAPENLLAGLSFQVFGENLGDVDYVTNRAPNATSGSTLSTFGPPRTWGVQINYAWGE